MPVFFNLAPALAHVRSFAHSMDPTESYLEILTRRPSWRRWGWCNSPRLVCFTPRCHCMHVFCLTLLASAP